jgi:hypothetical protein
MHSIIGLIFISLPSLFSPHVLVAAETHNFAPNWKNCNPVQSSVITKAWEGAFKMAERLKDKVDWRENPAALDFFGKETLDAYGADFLIEVFRYVTNTKFTPLVFCGTADANYGVPTTCANSWIYADIASSSFKNITMLFCDGFFKLPSLEARMVEVEQLYVVPWTRLDLTTFYPNQG